MHNMRKTSLPTNPPPPFLGRIIVNHTFDPQAGSTNFRSIARRKRTPPNVILHHVLPNASRDLRGLHLIQFSDPYCSNASVEHVRRLRANSYLCNKTF